MVTIPGIWAYDQEDFNIVYVWGEGNFNQLHKTIFYRPTERILSGIIGILTHTEPKFITLFGFVAECLFGHHLCHTATLHSSICPLILWTNLKILKLNMLRWNAAATNGDAVHKVSVFEEHLSL